MKKLLIGILAVSLVMALAGTVSAGGDGGFTVDMPPMNVSVGNFSYSTGGFTADVFDVDSGWCSGNFGIGKLDWDEGGRCGDELLIKDLFGGWNGGHFDITDGQMIDASFLAAGFGHADASIGNTLDFTTWCTHLCDPDWEVANVDAFVAAGLFDYTNLFEYDIKFYDVDRCGKDLQIGIDVGLGTLATGIGAIAAQEIIYAIGSYDDSDGCRYR